MKGIRGCSALAVSLLVATIQYQIPEVADRNVGVVPKVPKKFLPKAEASPDPA